MPDLPWDPKWPGELEQWTDEYKRARGNLTQPEFASLSAAFTAINDADAQEAFRHLREIHTHSKDRLGLWPWRWALWQMYCVPIFDVANDDALAGIARAVYDGVPGAWLQYAPTTDGIPTSWHGNRKRIWAFKATVLLIGGLMEKALSLTSVQITQRVAGFFDERASTELREEIHALLPGLVEALAPVV